MAKKVAVVTGSNKGIGFATVKALCSDPTFDGIVYLTSRDVGRGEAAVEELKKLGLSPKFHQLDVDSKESISKFRDHLKSEHGGLDILINNAAGSFRRQGTEPFRYRAEELIRINYWAQKDVCKAMWPLLRKGSRVVNVSSCEGHLSKINGQSPQNLELQKQFAAEDLTEEKLDELIHTFIDLADKEIHYAAGWPNSDPASHQTYKVSKVCLSALTRIQQKELDKARPGDDILINHCHPGYVDTDMTHHEGPLTIEQGSVAPTYLALLPPGSTLRGAYVWHDKQVIDWVSGVLPAPGY